MPTLAELNKCTGCTACASACPKDCISMITDENGFKYPMVNKTVCVSCGLCEKSCPVVVPFVKSMKHPIAYAAYSKDEPMRMVSSSGGIFTELSKILLSRGGIVYGAAYDKEFQVIHIGVEDEPSLSLLRGAKYAQSDFGNIFTQIKKTLETGRLVLFSGTPCQVGGLKAFLKKEHENLITVDFVCHGVPSPMAWSEYIRFRAKQDIGGGLPSAVNLRSKTSGWSRYRYSNRFEYADGTVNSTVSGDSLYMQLFGANLINREACSDCLFKGYNRCSDLTIGDFWGSWDVASEMDDNKGTSVVLSQSERGAKLLGELEDRLVVKEVALDEASHENGAMLKSSPIHPRRQEALDLIRDGRSAECAGWFKPSKISLYRRTRNKIGRIIRCAAKIFLK